MAGFVMGEMHRRGRLPARAGRRSGLPEARASARRWCTALRRRRRARGRRAVYLSTFREPPWNAPFSRGWASTDVGAADYLPWMTEHRGATGGVSSDITTRVFMRLALTGRRIEKKGKRRRKEGGGEERRERGEMGGEGGGEKERREGRRERKEGKEEEERRKGGGREKGRERKGRGRKRRKKEMGKGEEKKYK